MKDNKMKNSKDDIKLWAKIYNDTFPIKESVEINDADIAEQMTIVVETPGGETEITLNGEYETNAWFIDLLRMAVSKNPNYRSVSIYAAK